MTVVANPSVVTTGLVFCLDAANPRSYPGSGSSWYDVSGNGYTATLYGNPTYASGAIQFRYASSQYAAANFNAGVLKATNTTGTWSIESIWKNIGPPVSGESFIAGRVGCHGGIYTYPSSTNTLIYQAIKTASCWTGALNVNIYTLTPNQTVYSAMTYNAGTVKSYINGSLIGTYTFDYTTYGMQAYDNNFYIGGMGNPSYYGNDANIMNVSAYSIALSADQIAQNFNAYRGRYGI